jgi:hypothetical protein
MQLLQVKIQAAATAPGDPCNWVATLNSYPQEFGRKDWNGLHLMI